MAIVVIADDSFVKVAVCDAPDVTIVACIGVPDVIVVVGVLGVTKLSISAMRRVANGGAGTTKAP